MENLDRRQQEATSSAGAMKIQGTYLVHGETRYLVIGICYNMVHGTSRYLEKCAPNINIQRVNIIL